MYALQDVYLSQLYELRVRYSEMLSPLVLLLQAQLEFHRVCCAC